MGLGDLTLQLGQCLLDSLLQLFLGAIEGALLLGDVRHLLADSLLQRSHTLHERLYHGAHLLGIALENVVGFPEFGVSLL